MWNKTSLILKKKEIKFNIIIKQNKMIKIDDVAKEIIKEHNLNWPHISNHPYRI